MRRHLALGLAGMMGSLAQASLTGPPAEPGLMLRPGNWDGDIGTFELPAALLATPPARWPNDRWQRLSIAAGRARIDTLPTPARQRPPFLAKIAAQVQAAEAGHNTPPLPTAPGAVPGDEVRYLRFAGQPLRQGEVALYRFNNGTHTLTPMLDHRYALQLGTVAFAFTVRQGLPAPQGGRQGERQGGRTGDGAHYTIEYGGQHHAYHLPEYGRASKVNAMADLDGDGKPDFLITVAGNNRLHEYLLLSTLARPGANPPSAVLRSTGC